MRKIVSLVVVALVCTTVVACQPGGAGLSDQDKAAIRKVVDDGTKLTIGGKGDYTAYVKLYYAEDATVLMPNMPPVQGQAALQAAFAAMPTISEFKADILDIDGRGDLAYVRGNYTMTMNPPGAPPVTDKGKYVEVWKKQADGSWKVAYDSWSSDLPLPGLVVPTGAMAANASAEVKKLGDTVGRWQIDGKVQLDPMTPPAALSTALDCQWFAGGLSVVCLYNGTIGGAPYQETSTYSYDTVTKAYAVYNVNSTGKAILAKLTIEQAKWVSVFDTHVDGKPAKLRLTLTNVTPEGGDWKQDVSVAGGAWTVIGEGKFVKAK